MPTNKMLHAIRNETMRITQLRKDIEELSKPVLMNHGFSQVGELGEHVKTGENGNKLAVLIEGVKDSDSFSISIRVLVRYQNIEAVFGAADSRSEYTVNKVLASESIRFDSYATQSLGELLNRLISVEARNFLTEYGSDEAIVSNLNNNDYQTWVTSDKVAQFKVRLASAVLANNAKALAIAKGEALKFCDKPWSEPNREVIQRLCACV